MKKNLNNVHTQDVNDRSRIRIFIEKQKNKIKQGQFTCPICKEVFQGLSQLGAHLKKHCT